MIKKMLIGAVLLALIFGAWWWTHESKSSIGFSKVGEVKTQVFDGRQQVPTSKATGTVVAKGRLY